MEASTLQIVQVGLNLATAGIAGAIGLWIKNSETRLEMKIRTWIQEQDYITKTGLKEELEAFANKFQLTLLKQMNGDEAGYMRKSECALTEEKIQAEIKACAKAATEAATAARKSREAIERTHHA